jgi:hypothetical protein
MVVGVFLVLLLAICRDPPLRLDFDEATPLGTVFDGQNKLKLVTHCRDSDSYEQNLLEEYLAYRFYNLLTPISLGVQLAEITYLDDFFETIQDPDRADWAIIRACREWL